VSSDPSRCGRKASQHEQTVIRRMDGGGSASLEGRSEEGQGEGRKEGGAREEGIEGSWEVDDG